MADLSPTTRAIVAAFDDCYELCGPFDDNWQELCLAAALRAAANAVVPEQGREHRGTAFSWGAWAGRQNTRRDLLAIAAELEGSDA